MNTDEMADWLDYHRQRFPNFGKWLNGNPDTVKTWRFALDGVPLEIAQRITDDMQRGEIDPPHDLDWERLAGIVAAEAKARLAYAYEPPAHAPSGTPSCPRCQDTGLVSVWHSYSVYVAMGMPTAKIGAKGEEVAIRGTTIEDSHNRRKMCCPCDCPHGDRHIKEDGGPHWKGWRTHHFRFSRELYAELDDNGNVHSDESRRRLLEFCGRVRAGLTSHNYNGRESCFDEWNAR